MRNFNTQIKSFIFGAAGSLLVLLFVFPAWAGTDAYLPKHVPTEKKAAAEQTSGEAGDSLPADDVNWDAEWEAGAAIADPLEPLNRLFFHFNDKLYYWVLKPVARVYSAFIPDDLQLVVRNFFDNLEAPGRAVNCLLQGRLRNSSHEAARFVLNSTFGILGFGDFAADVLDLHSSPEDTGQTLGFYGAGGGFYINWPFLGPSNLRDSLGKVADTYLHPFTYLDTDWEVTAGAKGIERVNYTALTLGDYELFTETALDPYAAVKDAYQQYRQGLIENR